MTLVLIKFQVLGVYQLLQGLEWIELELRWRIKDYTTSLTHKAQLVLLLIW